MTIKQQPWRVSSFRQTSRDEADLSSWLNNLFSWISVLFGSIRWEWRGWGGRSDPALRFTGYCALHTQSPSLSLSLSLSPCLSLSLSHTHTHTHTHTQLTGSTGETCCNLGGREQRASLMQRLAGAFDVEPSHSLLAPHTRTHTHTHTHTHTEAETCVCVHRDTQRHTQRHTHAASHHRAPQTHTFTKKKGMLKRV